MVGSAVSRSLDGKNLTGMAAKIIRLVSFGLLFLGSSQELGVLRKDT
jgi:hypothetical protein